MTPSWIPAMHGDIEAGQSVDHEPFHDSLQEQEQAAVEMPVKGRIKSVGEIRGRGQQIGCEYCCSDHSKSRSMRHRGEAGESDEHAEAGADPKDERLQSVRERRDERPSKQESEAAEYPSRGPAHKSHFN